jgi:cytochrome c peroxidase
MLLARGVFRIGIPLPVGVAFELVAVDDPYGHASAAELSLFRRPLPAANLTFISQVMWDGRVTGANVTAALANQSNAATQGHSERSDPIAQETRDAIVAFEAGLFNAQLRSRTAGRLDAGARGGPDELAGMPMVAGRFDLFDAWATDQRPARRAIYRGQELFNTRLRSDGRGPCQGCHSTQNVGTNALGRLFDVGVAARRAPEQPLYTLRKLDTGELVTTTDPGRALITGSWNDVSKFKTPSLRGLAARAPYFHDGSAATLEEVVRFYAESLGFDFTEDEAADLVAFLAAL